MEHSFEDQQTQALCNKVYKWAAQRLHELEQNKQYDDMLALYSEFQEWFEVEDEDIDNLEVFTIDSLT